MKRAVVIDEDAANRFARTRDYDGCWLKDSQIDLRGSGITRVQHDKITYLLGANATPTSRLLVISGDGEQFLPDVPEELRYEAFGRILRAALHQFQPHISIHANWKPFHSGSLLSFQSNRWNAHVRHRVFLDLAPEGTEHVYAYRISVDPTEPLDRAYCDVDLFTTAVVYLDAAISSRPEPSLITEKMEAHELKDVFPDSNIHLGLPFSVWRDSRLTVQQREFFNAPFTGPLRVRGPAGTGKTQSWPFAFSRSFMIE
jgi:hypothetical protein